MARNIHQISLRSGPFVVVHPASMPESLFESEFFGYERGAFTGAIRQKIGLFELADQGTLFIDEVGEIPPLIQTKLLRVLQDQRFMRLGGTREILSRFRLVAATNRDLWKEVREGRFREDLLYRISVVPLTIPPLRERKQDIPGPGTGLHRALPPGATTSTPCRSPRNSSAACANTTGPAMCANSKMRLNGRLF
ncbi:sigma 54-interacting transcriptional regulator [Bilophila wadsworthia]|uniref:sigma 54-interacting transcriptional regulator n=1 Tax=Bilophila wadsworthia TaxID=35833 RepID=UPI003521BB6D